MAIKIERGSDNVPFVQLGRYKMRLDLEDLSPEYKQRALEELRETPENVAYGLSKLKELIRAEPDFYAPEDDVYLTKFLRPCRFIPENAFRIMTKFYRFKIRYPKFSKDITPKGIRKVFDQEVFKLLPTRTSKGCRIMIMSLEKWNPKEIKLEDLFKAVMVVMEIAMLEPKTQCAGVHVILDTKGLSMNHISSLSPSLAKTILEWLQDCVAVRLKGIHVINQPYIFNMAYMIFKPFMGERLRNSLYFHGDNMQSLCDHVSADGLPAVYGGTADIPEYPGTILSDMLFLYEADFVEFQTYGYNHKERTASKFKDTKEELTVISH